MGSPQEPDVVFGQARGDGLVGRQHELLDDLMAFVIDGEMSAGDLSCVAQLDLDLGKSSSSAPRAIRRRRRIIASSSICAQHAGDRGNDAGMIGRGLLHDFERLLVGEAMVDLDRRPREPLGGQDPLGCEVQEAH